MHRWAVAVLAACAMVVAACGDDDSPTAPSAAPMVFGALLSPANEVPPVTNAESGGTGAMQVTIQATRDASNNITGGTATFFFQMSGFPADMIVVGAHIHPGVSGVNGPVVVSTGLTAAQPFRSPTGTSEYVSPEVPVTAATIQQIMANPAAFYFNIHSPLNAGGFARGQMYRIQ